MWDEQEGGEKFCALLMFARVCELRVEMEKSFSAVSATPADCRRRPTKGLGR